MVSVLPASACTEGVAMPSIRSALLAIKLSAMLALISWLPWPFW